MLPVVRSEYTTGNKTHADTIQSTEQGNIIKQNSRQNISQDQFHCLTCSSTEIIPIYGNLNVGMAVDIFEYFLQQVEAALHARQNGVCYFAFFVLLQFLLYVSKN